MRFFYKFSVVIVAALGCGACDKGNKKDSKETEVLEKNLCESVKQNECTELETQAEARRAARDLALNEDRLPDAIRAQIDLESLLAHLDLYKNGTLSEEKHMEIDLTHNVMIAFIESDAIRNFDTLAPCSTELKICSQLRSDLESMQATYRLLLEQQGEQAIFDRKAQINYRIDLLTAYSQGGDPKQIERLDHANRAVTGIFDRLTIGSNSNLRQPVKACSSELKERCSKLESEIAAASNRLRAASSGNDDTQINYLILHLNHLTEILSLHREGLLENDTRVAEATSRYERLQSFVSTSRPAYRTEELQEIKKVNDKFGYMHIKDTDDSGWQTVEVSDHKPWAGYWYPFRHTDMFADANSPLQKFDAVLKAAGRAPGSADWERKKQSDGQPWESSDGLCDAWAVAASLTLEPTQPITYMGVTFEPWQIKGLLVQKYSQLSKERYGIPYQGRIATDGLGQDLRPEAFHQLVKSMLENNEIPVVDTDPDFEMWNKPLYKYEWRILKDTEVPHAYIVEAKAYYVKWRNLPSNDTTNYTPGRGSDLSIPQYRYRLIVNPAELDSDGAARVIYGEWLVDDLRAEYPDTVFRVSAEQDVSPRNPVVKANLDILNELISQY